MNRETFGDIRELIEAFQGIGAKGTRLGLIADLLGLSPPALTYERA